MRLFRNKADVRQRNKKKRVSISFVTPLFILLCATFFWYAYLHWNEWLKVLDNQPMDIMLKNNPKYTTGSDIQKTLVKYDRTSSYFSQDVQDIKRQIESLPWVKYVEVRRIWPNILNISVADFEPVAIWNGNQYLSAEGKIFSLPANRLQNNTLPNLSGPDFQGLTVLSVWNKINASLKLGKMVLKSVSVDNRGAWDVTLSDGVVLKLGRGAWKEKLDRFMTIYPQIEVPENKKLAYIDLRYNTGLAVKLIESELAEPQLGEPKLIEPIEYFSPENDDDSR